MDGKWDSQFVVDPFQAGAGTSHNMNANEVIANRATQILGGEIGVYYVHPNDHVNMAQSTNDVIPTSIRLGALWRVDELLTSLKNLQSAFEAKAKEFDDVVKSGSHPFAGCCASSVRSGVWRVCQSGRARCGARPQIGLGVEKAWHRRHSCRVRFERTS